jgi:hypothetical protein
VPLAGDSGRWPSPAGPGSLATEAAECHPGPDFRDSSCADHHHDGPGPGPAASVQHHLDPGPVDQAPKLAAEAKPAGPLGPGPSPDAEAGSGAPAPRRHSSSLPAGRVASRRTMRCSPGSAAVIPDANAASPKRTVAMPLSRRSAATEVKIGDSK